MNKCKNAEYRFGTTGTLDGTETNKLAEGLFGLTHKVIATKDLQVRGTLAVLISCYTSSSIIMMCVIY